MRDVQADQTRVVILSSASGGGGGIAARRLASTLDARPGLSAEFLTGESFGGFLPPQVAPMMSMSNKRDTDTHYTLEYPGYRRDWMVDFLAGYDVVNIHWASYLLSLGELDALSRRGTRMLFMLHDFHYITGGCHYPAGCRRMATGCYGCPQVDDMLCDITYVPVNLRIKQGIFARPNVHLAAPSQFLRDAAVASGIVPAGRAHVMRNPYEPMEPAQAWPADGTIRLLVIADSLTERRKGMPLAVQALNHLAARLRAERPGQRVEAHVVGATDDTLRRMLAECELPHRLHGRITDHAELVEIFAICDILLTCSFEDNWPNILVEAGAYGVVPVVGPGHGCEEFARTYGIGQVTAAYAPDLFAAALMQVMADLDQSPAGAARRNDTATRIRADHRVETVTDRFLEIAGGIGPA